MVEWIQNTYTQYTYSLFICIQNQIDKLDLDFFLLLVYRFSHLTSFLYIIYILYNSIQNPSDLSLLGLKTVQLPCGAIKRKKEGKERKKEREKGKKREEERGGGEKKGEQTPPPDSSPPMRHSQRFSEAKPLAVSHWPNNKSQAIFHIFYYTYTL